MNFKKTVTSSIAIVCQILILISATVWYLLSREIEPLIAMIGAIGVVATTLITRSSSKDQEKSNLTIEALKSKKGINIKTNQTNNSNSKIRDLESGEEIEINIDQK